MSESARERRVDPDGWDAAIARTDGRQLVVGGPGTGKTEFLVRRVAHLLTEARVESDAIVVLSFGRRAAADLRNRLRSSLDIGLGAIEITTYHSFAARLLEVAFAGRWTHAPQILTGPEQTAMVRRLLADEDPGRWSVAYRPLLDTSTFADEVTDFLLRTAEQMLDDARLGELAADRDDWRGLPEFVTRYRRELRRAGRIDYGELLVEAAAILAGDPGSEVRERTRYVLVDEYQDTTTVQVHLLDTLAARGNLTVSADPYQSIYSFRGSDVRNVVRFTETHPDATRLVLTTSFRTPHAILQASERITAGEIPGSAGRVLPAPATGRVDVELFEQVTEEAEWVAAEIQRMHLADRIALRRIAVFVRSKRRFLPELSRALERRHIPHDLPDSRLVDQPAVRLVLDLVAAATSHPADPEQTAAIRRILLGDLIGVSLSTARDLERRRLRGDIGWSEILDEGVPHGRHIADLLRDPAWATDRPAAEGLWHLWTSLPQLAKVVDDARATDTRAAWASLMQVLTRWNERNPRQSLADFRHATEDADFEAQPLLRYRTPESDRVTLTTLHQSKGLEFDVVFICDAVEGVFPDLRSRDSLLGVRHILDHLPTDNAGYVAFRLQEERRLAYTAMTRASRRVVWTATTTGAEDGVGMRSRFLSLVTGTDDVAPRHRPVPTPITTGEAEAALRRIVADPFLPAAHRIAALGTLATADDSGLRPLGEMAGIAPRGPDVGVMVGPLRLSPSQADLYDACPRRYALERRLHVSNDSLYLRFGTLVHDVLEQVERAALATGRSRSTLAEALERLDQVFEPADFGGGHVAEHWKRRAIGGLEHLYAHWPKASGDAALLEHDLRTDLGGATWYGRADRIERRGAGVAVVDYKTSRSPASTSEAAGSIQLGFYVHAASGDTEVAEHGPVTAAEFWYPLQTERKSLATRSFDLEAVGDVILKLETIAAGIAAEDWTPKPGPGCTRCGVAGSCPVVATGGEEFA